MTPAPTPDAGDKVALRGKTLTKDYLESLGLPDDPNELLTAEEHDALNQHLANLGWQRKRILPGHEAMP